MTFGDTITRDYLDHFPPLRCDPPRRARRPAWSLLPYAIGAAALAWSIVLMEIIWWAWR